MAKDQTISEELRALSPAIDNISRELPYQVPEGYFHCLSDQILNRIRSAGSKEQPTFPGESFREGLAPEIVSPILVEIGRQLPFTLPQGYFDTFPAILLDRIHSGETRPSHEDRSDPGLRNAPDFLGSPDPREELENLSPLLSQAKKSNPFHLPPAYFEDLAANVVSGVQAIEFVNDELENLSPLMASLKGKPTYQVPENYFRDLTDKLLEKVRQEQAPVVSLSGSAFKPGSHRGAGRVRSILKYAAAAVLGGLLVTGGWMRFHRSEGAPDITKNLSRVSDQEIENYLDNHNIPLAEAVENSTATLDINDSDIKSLLGDVPDEELNQYLDDQVGARSLATN